MYVLVEAYRGSPRRYLDDPARLSPAEYAAVGLLLDDTARVKALREIRDYMSHRDVRRYYDAGRLGVATVGPQWYREVETAFAKMFLLGIDKSASARSDGSNREGDRS